MVMPERVSSSHFSWRQKLAEDWLVRCGKLNTRVRELDGMRCTTRRYGHAIGLLQSKRLSNHTLSIVFESCQASARWLGYLLAKKPAKDGNQAQCNTSVDHQLRQGEKLRATFFGCLV